jgi:hypothetical protein
MVRLSVRLLPARCPRCFQRTRTMKFLCCQQRDFAGGSLSAVDTGHWKVAKSATHVGGPRRTYCA